METAFPGFTTAYTDCPSGARVFAYYRSGADTDAALPVLVLLHGYPQNALKYKHFVREVPPHWRVLVPDLPGYGNSTKARSPAGDARAHSKRAWAEDVLVVADALFGAHTQLVIFGHDRGGRTAYRLALDHPERVAGAALLDIVPTSYVWGAMRLEDGHRETMHTHHWVTLAAPYPLPETMIAANPQFYFEFIFAGWAGSGMKDPTLEWVRDSIAPYLDPERGRDRISAACEDYRAGATHDLQDDIASSISPLAPPTASSLPVFTCPLLILSSYHLRRRFDVDAIWTALGTPGKVKSIQVGDETTGHFLVNERQEETGRHMRAWLSDLFEGK
ncbi:hypothetical protein M0805_006506 [Coniferiporia weirii]|nr:hypothetical protein M0805_006506 [Coniferiporia weirii]